jgi:predicted SprT family Zn-dependent metalloprotease
VSLCVFRAPLHQEISHLAAFEKFEEILKPHGNEWKYSFQRLMIPYIRPEIFQVNCFLYWQDISKPNGQQ